MSCQVFLKGFCVLSSDHKRVRGLGSSSQMELWFGDKLAMPSGRQPFSPGNNSLM